MKKKKNIILKILNRRENHLENNFLSWKKRIPLPKSDSKLFTLNRGIKLIKNFKEAIKNPKGDYFLYRVGDAISSRNIHSAIYDSLRICKNI